MKDSPPTFERFTLLIWEKIDFVRFRGQQRWVWRAFGKANIPLKGLVPEMLMSVCFVFVCGMPKSILLLV